MRLWMVDPKIMCKRHLLGEHVESHMFLGHMKKEKSIAGFIKHNCYDSRLFKRHEQLKKEMLSRGYRHDSEMDEQEVFGIVDEYPQAKVNRKKSLADLIERCEHCRKRYEEVEEK